MTVKVGDYVVHRDHLWRAPGIARVTEIERVVPAGALIAEVEVEADRARLHYLVERLRRATMIERLRYLLFGKV
jgi:hypothetical protein